MTAYKMLGPESLAVGSQVGKGYRINPDKIRCPKLVIGCKQDNIAMESMEEKLARFLKADKYIAYGQFGHMIMIEKGWEKSAEDIKNWLSSTVKNWS
jgi:poly(3-hydroxyalkanoate) synthetase